LEAWRRLYRHIHKGSLLQKHTLGMKIQSPANYLKEAGNLSIGIDKWEQDIRSYVAAGGQWPAEDAMVMNLCSALPSTLRSNLIWRTNEFQSYLHFKHYITEQVERLEHFNGKNAIMFMGEDEDEDMLALAQEKLKDFPVLMEVQALGRGTDGRWKKGLTAKRPPSTAGRDQRFSPSTTGRDQRLPGARRDEAASKVRCINCGGNHMRSKERATQDDMARMYTPKHVHSLTVRKM
jgi:hypothetical protein